SKSRAPFGVSGLLAAEQQMPVVVLCASELRPGTDPFVQLKGTLEALDGGVVATIGMSGRAIAELVRGNTNPLGSRPPWSAGSGRGGSFGGVRGGIPAPTRPIGRSLPAAPGTDPG